MWCLQSHLIDAPVLVDLPQGSIRYRFVDRRTQPNAGLPNSNLSLQSSDIPDGPHRGCNDLQHKKGYFFQAKLADYSTGQSNQKLDSISISIRTLMDLPVVQGQYNNVALNKCSSSASNVTRIFLSLKINGIVLLSSTLQEILDIHSF